MCVCVVLGECACACVATFARYKSLFAGASALCVYCECVFVCVVSVW